MKIGIISDVHDNLRHLSKAIEFFNAQKIGLLINCGDWDMPFVMRSFIKLNCPIKGVLGNGDADLQKFQYQMQNLKILKDLDLQLTLRFQDFKVDGIRIGIYHGDDKILVRALIESQLFDVLCLGHTHIPKIEKSGRTLVINPGTLVGYKAEKGIEPVTVAIYDTETKKAKIVDLKI